MLFQFMFGNIRCLFVLLIGMYFRVKLIVFGLFRWCCYFISHIIVGLMFILYLLITELFSSDYCLFFNKE
jgi:hypothetical protein